MLVSFIAKVEVACQLSLPCINTACRLHYQQHIAKILRFCGEGHLGFSAIPGATVHCHRECDDPISAFLTGQGLLDDCIHPRRFRF